MTRSRNGRNMAAMTTGMDLRLERTAARVRLKTLAARMGRHLSTLVRYEGLAVVPDPVATEYRAALASIAKDATSANTEQAVA